MQLLRPLLHHLLRRLRLLLLPLSLSSLKRNYLDLSRSQFRLTIVRSAPSVPATPLNTTIVANTTNTTLESSPATISPTTIVVENPISNIAAQAGGDSPPASPAVIVDTPVFATEPLDSSPSMFVTSLSISIELS